MVARFIDRLLDTPSARLEALVKSHDEARAHYEPYRKYWNGDHEVRLTARLKQFLQLSGFHAENGGFRDNLCPIVIESLSDRLRIASFSVPGEESPPPVESAPVPGDANEGKVGPIAQFAQDAWQRNRGERLQMDVHEAAVALGDAYVLTEWDPIEERVRFSFEDPAMVRVVYDPENASKVLLASKRWTVSSVIVPVTGELPTDASVRLNVYYPDRIERWIRNGLIGGGIWRKFFGDDAPDQWPIWWTDTGEEGGEPLGIAVTHFPNQARGGNFGRSEIADVIPLQDALNKAVVDAVRVMDAMGWPQRYGTGISEAPTDDLIAIPGSFWWTKEENAKFGQMEDAGAEGIINVWNKFEESVSAVTRTPQHLFRVTNGVPSGEALKTAENGLVSKAIKRSIVFGDAWEDVMELAFRIARANGAIAGELPDSGFLVEWENPETRGDELQHIQAINAKEGISRRQRWREYGYTDEQIERMESELANEPNVLEDALAAFDAGGGASAEMRGRPMRGA